MASWKQSKSKGGKADTVGAAKGGSLLPGWLAGRLKRRGQPSGRG